MRKLPIILGVVATVALPLAAAVDPIAARQALMQSNGGAAAVAGGIFKGEIAFDPAVARSTLLTLAATAEVYGDYFPEGSEDPSRSDAAPAIWSNRAGFDAEVASFHERAAAAVEAVGRDGPADAAAFQAAAAPVLETCRTCHETYRVKRE